MRTKKNKLINLFADAKLYANAISADKKYIESLTQFISTTATSGLINKHNIKP